MTESVRQKGRAQFRPAEHMAPAVTCGYLDFSGMTWWTGESLHVAEPLNGAAGEQND